jgi:glycosyltransferase involved in cell wall biosynthesis
MTTLTTRGAIRTVALLGNHLPRHCGIATFTTDLTDALAAACPDLACSVVAMNDRGKAYGYPERVRMEIAEGDLGSYHRAADFLNVNDADVLSLQHEYGIFGGKAGAYVLTLLRELRMPIVTTLHTILAEPSAEQRVVMDELCAISERLVVMSAQGAELLSTVHRVPSRKIDLIPHGIPVLPGATHSKKKLGVQGRQVLLTFGLLSPDKGIEHVIDALPAIAKRFPNVVYIVLGATHPHVKENDGEAYRLMLERRGHRLGVDENLVFHDRFVSESELVQFLSAADIYITPYLNPEQITSGTLAFAVGSGKSVISTPYRYARELLADGRGVLVPWKDAQAIGAEAIGLLGDDRRRAEIERRAAGFGKAMAWPVVASAYVQTFQRAVVEHRGRVKPRAGTIASRHTALPELNLAHLRAMTDDTGMLQHAAWTVPRYEDGYCLDDNARALMLLAIIEEARVESSAVVRALATRYLAFVRHARAIEPRAAGRFRNFMSYGRLWTEEQGSEDSHGRTVWSLGTVVARCPDAGRRALADDLFRGALEAPLGFTSPRAWAYTLLGIDEYLRAIPGHDGAVSLRRVLADRLVDLFHRASRDDWPWFEDRLTYANARLSQALIRAGDAMKRDDMWKIGLRSLEWLRSIQRTDGHFAPIGSDGFFVRGGKKAEFDHQPLEACGMVSACLDAFRLTGQKHWADWARTAFGWFLGQNHLEQWVYDASTGGCRDGLHRERRNENQGAEATVSFLTALMELRQVECAVDSQTALRASRSAHQVLPGLVPPSGVASPPVSGGA